MSYLRNISNMKKLCIIFCLQSVFAIGFVSFQKSPETEITNGLIHASLYLPDPITGYYRGSRFDWSGVIASLEYNGHSYFGQWFNNYNPTKHDAIMGPVEAFDPIGYDEAKAGESFMKIGIGELTKSDDSPYDFIKFYPIVNNGKWKVGLKRDQARFSHELKGIEYSYEYMKTVKLVKDKPVMILSHTLKNTGRKTIETTAFNHNFFVIDKQPTGPGFEVIFPFNITENSGKMEDYAMVRGNKLIFLKELNNRNVSFKDVASGKGSKYDIQIDNRNTGAGVKISGDQPVTKIVFWSAAKTVCPEPYIKIKIDPGKKISWDITYEFYTNQVIK